MLALCCTDLGLLDLLQLQDKLPGLLLYHVSLGGLNGDTLLQRGSIDTLLSLATGDPYPLNFSVDPTNAQRVNTLPFPKDASQLILPAYNVIGKSVERASVRQPLVGRRLRMHAVVGHQKPYALLLCGSSHVAACC